MKLRFGIDANAYDRIRGTLDSACDEPPVGRRLSYLYLDTADDALAAEGVALRFRRSAALGTTSPARPWRRQEIWPKDRRGTDASIKKLGIKRLKQRLDATFDIHIERWTWLAPNGWAAVSLDRGEISTGSQRERFVELRIVCRRKHADAAMRYAVELGAMHLCSIRTRARGQALLAAG